jgi:alpha-tubulin suppressor-like RCC1 family protein
MIVKKVRKILKSKRTKKARPSFYKQNIVIATAGFLVLMGLTVAYSALTQNLNLAGQAQVRALSEIRINGISKTDGCGVDVYTPEFNVDTFAVEAELPALNCTVTYDVIINNSSTLIMGVTNITEILNNNPDVVYDLTNLKIGTAIAPQSDHIFQITYHYKPSISNLPSQTDFASILRLEFQEYLPPVLTVSQPYRNYEMFIRQSLTVRQQVAALDNIQGDITSLIIQTCTRDGAPITCPDNFNMQPHGQYQVTYNVTNEAGLSATPVVFNVLVWDFIKVDTGNYHTLALSSHGKVWAWGYGATYRLGFGNISNVSSPKEQNYLSNYKIIDIAAGYASSLAVDSDGYLWGWGSNSDYALGNNSTTTSQTPARVDPPTGKKFVAVDMYYYTGIALTDTGEVYVWGNGAYGATGLGNSTDVRTPTLLPGLPAMRAVAAGQYAGAAVATNGDLWTWGSNAEGALGAGFSGANSGAGVTSYYNKPNKYSGLTNMKMVSMAQYHVAALSNSGQVYTWGENYYGRLCNGNASANSYPPYATSITNGSYIDTNTYNTVMTTSAGRAYGCGSNNFGEAQIGSTSTSVTTPTINSQISSGIIGISAGLDASHALTNGGEVWGYGYSGSGEVGYGGTSSSATGRVWDFTIPPMRTW